MSVFPRIFFLSHSTTHKKNAARISDNYVNFFLPIIAAIYIRLIGDAGR